MSLALRVTTVPACVLPVPVEREPTSGSPPSRDRARNLTSSAFYYSFVICSARPSGKVQVSAAPTHHRRTANPHDHDGTSARVAGFQPLRLSLRRRLRPFRHAISLRGFSSQHVKPAESSPLLHLPCAVDQRALRDSVLGQG